MGVERAIQGAAPVGQDLEEFDPLAGVDPEVTELEDGTIEVEFSEEDLEAVEFSEAIDAADHNANLADFIEDSILDEIGSELVDLVEADDQSRSDWLKILNRGIEELGLKMDSEDVPFDGACTATHPLLIESVTKFQAKSFAELFPSKGPVETKILGFEDDAVRAQSVRVKKFMNYEVQHLMVEYGPELDRGLFQTAFTGSFFKKTYFDPVLGRPVSRMIRANDFIISYYATDLESCERYTHRFELSANELRKYQRVGFYRDVLLMKPADPEMNEVDEALDRIEGKARVTTEDEINTMYEVHCVYDLPGFEDTDEDGPTGIALPYIVTIDRDTQKILSIRRNWKEEDDNKRKRIYFVHYPFINGLGFYGYGYLHLIGSLAKTATSTLRQLVDAGTFATLPAGFKAHGLRVSGGEGPLSPGEFRDVQAPAMDLTKSLIPLPFKEPSATLFNLLQFIVTSAEKFADNTEQLLSDAKNYGPVGTTLAILEQGGKMYSAIHKRMHAAQAQDFKILAELNSEWLPDAYPFRVHKEAQNVLRADFDGRIDVVPVSDPNMPTQAHRVSRAQALFAIAAQAPQLHNMRKVIRSQYEALGIEDPEEYLAPPPEQAVPLDPITENVNIMTLKPVKAGPAQNHTAHIKAHMAYIQMPPVQKNPMALQAGMAHVFEHVALEYRLRIQQIIGQQLPPPGTPLPPELEEAIALASVEATESLLEEDLMKEVLSDPSAIVAMQGLAVEQQKNALKSVLDGAKLDLDYEKMLREDMNKDLDRWADQMKLGKELTMKENLEKYKADKSSV